MCYRVEIDEANVKPGAHDEGAFDGIKHNRVPSNTNHGQKAVYSIPPKPFEPIVRHFRVTHRVLDVPVAEIVLDCPCVLPPFNELEATGEAYAGEPGTAVWLTLPPS